MMQTSAIKFLFSYKYLALFPLACIEGPILALAVGFMIHFGYLSIVPAFFIMILGDFIPDSIYYFIGNFGNKEKLLKRFDTKSKLVSRHFAYIENAWEKHPWKTMFICKLAYGLSTPLLILGGLVRISYFKFIYKSVVVTILNYGILMILGYYLGKSYQSAVPYVNGIGIIITIIAVIFFFVYFLLQRYLKEKVIEIIEK